MLWFLFLFSDSILGNGTLPIALEGQALLMAGGGELLMQIQKDTILIITKKIKAFRRANEMQLEGKSIYKNVIL